MNRMVMTGLTAVLFAAAGTQAGVSFRLLGGFGATDVSADGRVVVGNTFDSYETVRWTEAEGAVLLGRATLPVLGVAAGVPGVSDDGTRVSATILSDDETFATQGIWTLGDGWQECTPMPEDGGILDQSAGSAWGISGDGSSVVGLYWRPGQPGGLAHASRWQAGTGVVDLGSAGGSSRANAANHDGSVVVGWTEADNGVWRPAVWNEGGLSLLTDTESFCEANAVNPKGDVIVGSTYDTEKFQTVAARWTWDGQAWIEKRLGVLPGTDPNFGFAIANGVTADGAMVVGFNRYEFGFGPTGGFIWTEESGMVEAVEFLEQNGVEVDPNFVISNLAGISADGGSIIGYGYDVNTFQSQSFLISIENACAPDCDGSGTLDLFDFLCFVNLFNSGADEADCDASGSLDLFDFLCFTNGFNAGC
jgi:uncharacterized membrane protein